MFNAQQNANDRAQHSLLNLTLYQPTVTTIEKDNVIIPPGMEILKDPNNLEIFLDLIIALQEKLNFDIISIPYLNLPLSILESVYKQRTNYIRSIGKEPFYVLNLKHNPQDFERIIKLLIDELELQLVGLVFQRFQSAVHNYRELSKHYSKDVLFFTIQIARTDPQFSEFSSPHYMPFLSSDLFSVAAPRTFDSEKSNKSNDLEKLSHAQPQKVEPSYNEKLLKLKIFNKRDLNLVRIHDHMKNYPELLNDVDNPNDYRLVNMLKNYMYEGSNLEEQKERFSNLKSFTLLHELKTSVKEFGKFQKYVKQSDTASYVSEHPLLNKVVTEHSEIIH